jgi:hypothetical protein
MRNRRQQLVVRDLGVVDELVERLDGRAPHVAGREELEPRLGGAALEP